MKPELIVSEMSEIDGYKIPVSMVREYKQNPEKFKRDYMCIPSQALEPYFKNAQEIDKVCGGSNLWDGTRISETANFGNELRTVHIDLALNKDACGIACGYKKDNIPIIDFLARIQAQKGGEIRFESIRDIIYAMVSRGAKIYKITMDGWQSIDSRQQFESKGYQSEIVSVDKDLSAYDSLKGFIYEGNIVLPNDSFLKMELKRLELVKGKKVDHPAKGSKDCADAVAGVIKELSSEIQGRVSRIGRSEVVQKTTSSDEINKAIQQQIQQELRKGMQR
jgi:hypothetical protein